MLRLFLVGLAVLVAGCSTRPATVDEPGTEPAPEKRLHFDSVLFDGTAYGALIPSFGDIDGDGRTDLLVGSRHPRCGEGRLLVLRNRGPDEKPDYAPPEWFHDSTPTGLIPES